MTDPQLASLAVALPVLVFGLVGLYARLRYGPIKGRKARYPVKT